jgi:predicted lipoprotein with Yx(FWY)xxD motif
MRKRTRATCVLVAGLGLLGTGCGGERQAAPSSGYGQPSSAGPVSSPPGMSAPPTAGPASSPPSSLGPVEIKGVDTSLGKVVVDGRGMTLYVFEKDSGGQPTCTGDCEKEWPPMLTNGQVTAGPGVSMSGFTVDRPDGTKQVAYGGWPLYYYAKDTKPGDMNGQAVVSHGAPWYVIGADNGQKIEKKR